jgi:hypothetical protein
MKQTGALALLALSFTACLAQHGLRPCSVRELSIRDGHANVAGGGTVQYTYTLTNTSNRTCSLFGYPSAKALDFEGRAVTKVVFAHAGSPSAGSENQAAQMIELKPGAQAWFMIDGNDGTGAMDLRPCRIVAGIRITPPGSSRPFREKFGFSTCIDSNAPHIYYLVPGVPG